MIKNIIFDFDGVVVDSEILAAQSFSQYLKLNHNIIFHENEFARFAGKKTIQIVSELSYLFKIKDEKSFFDDIISLASNIYTKNLKPINGIRNFLKNTNYNIIIGSNSIKLRVIEGLKTTNLKNFFDEEKIYTFDIVGIAKPEPDIFLKPIKEMNLKKEETIIIEDSAVGVKAAVSADIKVIGLTAGGHWFKDRSDKELYDAGAYKVVNNYEEVLTLINKL